MIARPSSESALIAIIRPHGGVRDAPERTQVEADTVTRDWGLTSSPPRRRIDGRPVLNQEDDHGKDDG